jgi:uncharacterized phage-associated protein
MQEGNKIVFGRIREEETMNTVFDIAKYVLSERGELPTMKLQKLCYYCQAWSLAWDGVSLFNEDFEAWANGPVCPRLFKKHKGVFLVDDGFLSDVHVPELTDTQKETVKAVLDHYGDMEPHELSELTHGERPWKETRSGVPPGEPCKRVIPKSLMQEYYAGL